MSAFDKKDPAPKIKGWEAPALKKVGTIADVLKGGGGKQSIVEADTGDINKPKGQS